MQSTGRQNHVIGWSGYVVLDPLPGVYRLGLSPDCCHDFQFLDPPLQESAFTVTLTSLLKLLRTFSKKGIDLTFSQSNWSSGSRTAMFDIYESVIWLVHPVNLGMSATSVVFHPMKICCLFAPHFNPICIFTGTTGLHSIYQLDYSL